MDVLLGLLAILVLVVLLFVGAAALGLWSLRRRNRVSAAERSRAPVAWLVTPTPGGRLHRRLRNVVVLAHLAGTRADVVDLVAEVEQQAVALDHHVVVTARMGRTERHQRWRELDRQVGQLEVLASRLVTAAVEALNRPALAGATGDADPLARIAERLDALEAARADLLELELASGLARPDPRFAAPPPPTSPTFRTTSRRAIR